jgi:two-component system chemotaxis response regulator CheY
MKIDVVVADDAPFVRDVLRAIITKAGHRVVGEAENGEQAVQVVLEKQPHVVIMDIVMPKMSGVQATREILKILPKTRVIACSTLDQENMMVKAIESGAVDFIHKPFNAKDVIKIIERVVEKKPEATA